MDPYDTSTNLIPYLQVFARRIRDGRLSSSHRSVRADTVSNALRNVGQAYARLGTPDVRNDVTGRIDIRIARQIRFYSKQDDPPRRVKPVPISVVTAIVEHAFYTETTADDFIAIADMICLGFFFLCRPGEHTFTQNNTPFKLEDVTLYRGGTAYTYEHCNPKEFDNAVSVALTFTTQKNGVKNEIIRNGMTGDMVVCPV